jgi:hypothetical protein
MTANEATDWCDNGVMNTRASFVEAHLLKLVRMYDENAAGARLAIALEVEPGVLLVGK